MPGTTTETPGWSGDALCASVVRGVADHLTESGWCQLLANWEITDGDDWAAHARGWVAESGLDAWVIQRDVQDPAAYIEMWLRDAGEHGRRSTAISTTRGCRPSSDAACSASASG